MFIDNIEIKATNKLPLGFFSIELGITIEPGKNPPYNQPNVEQIYYFRVSHVFR